MWVCLTNPVRSSAARGACNNIPNGHPYFTSEERASFHNRPLLITCHGISQSTHTDQTSNDCRVSYRTQQPITSREKVTCHPPQRSRDYAQDIKPLLSKGVAFWITISLDAHLRTEEAARCDAIADGNEGKCSFY